jgi:Zn-dependent M28 family amino/carboxypeptidase
MDAANQLLAKTGKTVIEFKQEIDKTGKPHSVPLKKIVRMETNVSHSSRYTMNVIGMIKGSDPSLRDEFVVIGAHYDHIGIKAELGEVYYGADDNASGTGALLEIAQAFSQCSRKPKRSILFIAFTGEERGLIGSQYYVDHPVVPLSKTVAMFNMDMIGRNDPDIIDIGCMGDENLITFSNDASRIVDINIHFNKDNIHVSTDHASFLIKDIPVLFYHDGGGDFAHKTIDTWDKLLPQKIEKVARLCFLTAYSIADKN